MPSQYIHNASSQATLVRIRPVVDSTPTAYPVVDSTPTTYEVAELLNLQAIRNEARLRR